MLLGLLRAQQNGCYTIMISRSTCDIFYNNNIVYAIFNGLRDIITLTAYIPYTRVPLWSTKKNKIYTTQNTRLQTNCYVSKQFFRFKSLVLYVSSSFLGRQ